MQIKMFEKTHMAYRMYIFGSPFISLIAFIMALKTFETNKLLSILYLILVIVTIQTLMYTYSQSKKAVEVMLSFNEGYFYFIHKDYSLVFSPSAIKNVAIKKSGKFVQLFVILEPKLVKVTGSDKDIATLNVKLTHEDYAQKFKPFYEGGEIEEEITQPIGQKEKNGSKKELANEV